MSSSRSSRFMLAILGLIVLGIVLPPLVSVRHFRDRITGSIGQALNRQVSVEKVHLRLLPQPGFDLHKFIVYDQPSFSAEPMLRADEVTASLRLSSLWRGRLEIASLSLKQPSLNLVRDDRGLWNIEALLQRASSIPTAPTANTRPEIRPRFPYIEADTGRINFKFGPEKTAYALTDADFALWLSSENEWSMRLEARPVRTDLNIADSGTLKLDGSFRRAATLGGTPMHFNLHWEHAQLGQLTKLLSGRDRGWRGAVKLDGAFVGTPANLAIIADTSIQDFRRYDIVANGALRLIARCSARYSAATEVFSQIACTGPSSGGLITARGTATGFPRVREYDLAFEAVRLPMQSVIAFARHAKQGLPDDLAADGTFRATVAVRKTDGAAPAWSGSGETQKFALHSAALGDDLALEAIPFYFAGPTELAGASAKSTARKHKQSPNPAFEPTSPEFRVNLGPFDVPLDADTAATATGSIGISGYNLALTGDARLPRLLQVARSLGLHAPPLPADGDAKLDLDLTGAWSGFAPVTVTGRAQLRAVTARVHGVAAPLEIASATAILSPTELKLQNLAASFVEIGPRFTGSVSLERGCAVPSGCAAHFDLHADELATDDLDQLFNPRLHRVWYQLLTGADSSIFARIVAQGRISADQFTVRSLDATHVSAELQIDHGKLRVSNLRADVLGGRHAGEWQADFTVKPPLYTGRGTLDKISLAQLSDLMHDSWATGPASLTYSGTMSGWTAAELFSSSAADFHFDWRQGTLRHIGLGTDPPLHVQRFTGQLSLRDRVVSIASGKLMTPDATYNVTGTATGIISKARDRATTTASASPEIAASPSSSASASSPSASSASTSSSPSIARPNSTDPRANSNDRRANAPPASPARRIFTMPATAPALDVELSLRLTRDSLHQFNVTGTLSNPRVVPAASPAEASLKP